MSNFIQDSIQEQIERGEVFYDSIYWDVTALGDLDCIINTQSSPLSLRAEIQANADLDIFLFSGATTSSDGSAFSFRNMNLSSGSSTTVTGGFVATVTGNGTQVLNARQHKGQASFVSPFTLESGIILNSSTKYLLRVTNFGANTAEVILNMFIREI